MVSISENPVVIDGTVAQSDGSPLSSLELADKATTERGTIFGTGKNAPNLVKIDLEQGPQGLGFNIVGGSDSPHIPGHSGIFVSIVKPDSSAFKDGRLSVGDLILAVNGIDIVNKTHDEVVSIFRSQTGSVELLVEIGAENRILNEHMITDTNFGARNSPITEISDSTNSSLRSRVRQTKGNGFPPSSSLSPSNVNDLNREEDDGSVSSCAPSVHSYLDDVPRTPKRPMSYLDPRNPSLVTEVLYVSIGLAVISLGIYVGYRVYRGRK
ncbi:hypothetical protein KIN20_011482 [Parelaphostrongylus tenuis]|uniref:PDZ domain-containing protein n=1 Tax=Parelaphostrongylus tenuis TaxID=148309 RepID=A0AAD5M9G7_PARTN|nr:hypothetical protein KIN20_011482 [Parelaphostrongylus tenuis]